MLFRTMCGLVILAGLAVNAQPVNVHGTVSNAAGKPIANATIKLAVQGLSATTSANGAYIITRTRVTQIPSLLSQPAVISLDNGTLEIGLANSSPVKVEIFDVKGTLLEKEFKQNVASGVYRLDIMKNSMAAGMLVVRATVGGQMVTFHYMPLNSGSYTVNSQASPVSTRLMKTAAAAIDTIKASATGYQAKSVPISSMDTLVNIALDTSNGTGPSIGCGKTLGSLNKSGTYTITSSSTSRTFIINIPTNYDKNTPYRLIFGMHCMGGSAIKVAGTDNGQDQSAYYYHVKTEADKDNIQAIYVAMQGDAGGTWQGEPDRKFFFDLQKMLKDTLCIDTTRVFSVGFSFGAMFTYTLSLEYPKILRAVTCIAPANYNMDQPTNNHVPIGYFQTTGISDGTCPWISSDANKTGGKYCLLQHIQDNGCTVPTSFTLATSGTHVSTNYSGCTAGYPVKFSSFQGGHQCLASDAGSSINWMQVETWAFFKQF